MTAVSTTRSSSAGRIKPPLLLRFHKAIHTQLTGLMPPFNCTVWQIVVQVRHRLIAYAIGND